MNADDKTLPSDELPGMDTKRLLFVAVAVLIGSRAYYALILRHGASWQAWSVTHPVQAILVLVPVAIFSAWLAGLLGGRYLSRGFALPSAVVGGVASTAMVNGLIGAVLGVLVGLIMVSRLARRWTIALFALQPSGTLFVLPVTWVGACWAHNWSQDGGLLGTADSTTVLASTLGIAIILPLVFTWHRRRRLVGTRPDQHSRRFYDTYWFRTLCLVPFATVGLRGGIETNALWQIHRLDQVGHVLTFRPPNAYFEIAIGRRHWSTVTGVNLSSRATDDDLLRLRYFPQLDWLTITNEQITSDGIKQVGHLDNVRNVQLEDVAIDDQSLRSLLGNANPIVLSLIRTHISDRSLPMISRWLLQSLRIDGLRRTGTDLACLTRCRTIDWLELNNVELDDATLAQLATLPSLRHLSVTDNQLEGTGLIHLSGKRWLGSLNLSNNPIDDRYLAGLVSAPVAWLDMNGIPLGDRGYQALAQLHNLNHLAIAKSGQNGRRLRNILPLLTKLRELIVDGSTLDAWSARLPIDTVILHVHGRQIDPTEVNRLASLAHIVERSRYGTDAEVRLEQCRLTPGAVAELFHHPFRLFTLADCQFDSRFRQALRSHVLLRPH